MGGNPGPASKKDTNTWIATKRASSAVCQYANPFG